MAPRELLVRRNALSYTTQRALSTPSVAMEVTNVTGAEFPDPDALATAANLEVRRRVNASLQIGTPGTHCMRQA